MQEYQTAKDKTAIGEMQIIMTRLEVLLKMAEGAVGHSRPVFSASEIQLIKDHLDLVIKYSAL